MTREAMICSGLLTGLLGLSANLVQAQEVVGEWEGAIHISGAQIPIVVEFNRTDGVVDATIDIQGAQDVPLINVSAEGNHVHFELQAGMGLAVFDGSIGEEGMAGTFTQSGSEGTFDLFPLVEADQVDLSGYNETERDALGDWEGALQVSGVTIPMTVHFRASARGFTATAGMQGATGIGLTAVSAESGRIHFELMGGPGLATFDGSLSGDSIGGSFSQSGQAGTFYLNRMMDTQSAAPVEMEDLPYAVEEVQFTNDSVTLAGTLTLPEGPGPHPAIVLITGSGAQNRDEDIFDFKIFGVIADYFTRHGIAVLRYDDRGVGGSSGSIAASTSEDFAADALAGIHLLQARADIASDMVGLMGHSEGGIVAPIAAAASDDVAFIVLMAGSAVTGEEILYEQGRLIMAAGGASEADLAEQREVQESLFAALRGEGDWEVARLKVVAQLRGSVEAMSPEQRAGITDTAAFFESRSNATIQGIQNEWFRFFLTYDPAPVLERVTVPVLGLFGELDLQVPPAQNAPAMEAALARGGNPDYRIEIVPRANHLFQEAVTGSPSEYATLAKAFAPGFLDLTVEWIRARAF